MASFFVVNMGNLSGVAPCIPGARGLYPFAVLMSNIGFSMFSDLHFEFLHFVSEFISVACASKNMTI